MSIVDKQKEIKSRSSHQKALDSDIKLSRESLRFARETVSHLSPMLGELKKRYNQSNKDGNFSDVSFCAKEINFYRNIVVGAQESIEEGREFLKELYAARKENYDLLVAADKEVTAMMAEA